VQNALQLNINFKTTIDTSNFLAQSRMKLVTWNSKRLHYSLWKWQT